MKTQANDNSVRAFIDAIPDPVSRRDCELVSKLMEGATAATPRMWGDSIVGFGSYHYKYASGREGDWFLTGFSPRKRNLTVYIMPGFSEFDELMSRLGRHKTGKSCLYIRRLDEIQLEVLGDLIECSVASMRRIYG
jgi:hypothetical protein